MCEYKFRNEKKCEGESFKNSRYCVLHITLPEDEDRENFKKINELKKKKVEEKVNKGDFNFEGAKLNGINVDFPNKNISGRVNFTDAVVENINMDGSKIYGYLLFNGANVKAIYGIDTKIGEFNNTEIYNISGRVITLEDEFIVEITNKNISGRVNFTDAVVDCIFLDGSKIYGDILFEKTKVNIIEIRNAEIGGRVYFSESETGADVSFYGTRIYSGVDVSKTKVKGNFYFTEAIIKKGIGGGTFDRIETVGEGHLSFYKTKFQDPHLQEAACRKAKIIYEELGNRAEADYHFYREMEAKRRQKKFIWRILELPVQYIFGYGTRPYNVLSTWFVVVFGFAFLFWIGEGVEGAKSLWECIYFSVVTATTLGYGDYHPTHGIFQGLAGFEAIFGAFMWAAFIVIFARKYMR